MTPDELAKALGGSRNGKWFNIAGPGHSSGDQSLGFCFDQLQPSGIRIFSFAGDDPHVCRLHVLKKLSSLCNGVSPVINQDAEGGVDQADINVAKALSFWHSADGVVGSPVEIYLAARGCLPSSPASVAEVIRFHPNCPMGKETVPAMVSVMRNVMTGEPTGIHRTALTDDGKAKRLMPVGTSTKMMLGRAKGAAAMLASSAAAMGVAEGIETALSAQKLFGLPVWACMSAQGIAGFPPVHGLTHLTIFADHDEAGIAAAHKCAARMVEAGIKGRITYPATNGDDWNCYLNKGTKNAD
jgi:putative DNA primase/helicase